MKPVVLLLCAALLSSGCSAFQRDAAGEPPVPMPPLKPAPETPQGVAVQQQAQQGTPLSVEVPTPPSSGPRIGDPDPLITLLEMESVAPSADESAVKNCARRRSAKPRTWSRCKRPLPGGINTC